MISGITNNLNPAKVAGAGVAPAAGAGTAGASSFADTLKNSINDVAKLQQDATKAVQDLATGKNEDVTGVMTAVEKSDLAFKTLLSIRTKLMEAYDEVKGMSV
jgi:flagellar hook-basal body complex protein FliE